MERKSTPIPVRQALDDDNGYPPTGSQEAGSATAVSIDTKPADTDKVSVAKSSQAKEASSSQAPVPSSISANLTRPQLPKEESLEPNTVPGSLDARHRHPGPLSSSRGYYVMQSSPPTHHGRPIQAGPPVRIARYGLHVPLADMTSRPYTHPDAIVRLPATIRDYQQAMMMIDQAMASPLGQRAVDSLTPEMWLNHISRQTGTYVRLSESNDMSLHIWGKPHRVVAARNLLETMISRFDKESVAKREGLWAKAQLHWEPRETYEKSKKDLEASLKELKREPETLDPASKKLFFAWPSGGPTMVQSLGVELEKLDSIRMEFKVHVYPSSAVEDYICVAGLKESDAGPILAQLRALSDEAIAKFNACVKAHMIEPPSHDAYMDDVVIVKYPHGAETLLQRAPSPARSVNDWSGEMERIKEANKKLLLSSVEKSLSMSHFFKGHLQMRVHFGSFVLDTAQRPKNATTGHGFEEFRTMLFLEKAKGRLIPRLRLDWAELLERCSQATDLLESMDIKMPLSSIRTMQPTYSASFEFSEPHSRLRLETYFKTVPGSCEIEAANHRWFKRRRGNEERTRQMAMQISMLDFERCDWQIDLDCFEPLDASTANLNTGLESFAAAVIFDPHLTSAQREFGSQPVKKIFFPPQPTVSRCVEKSALQFRIKGTGYILELIRFDKYKPGSSTQRQLGAGHAATWGATLFDPRWVSVLGGESSPNALRFERPAGRFEAFFPWSSGGNEGGFWEFMEVVNKVADLLKCPHNSNRQGRGVEGVSDLLRADFGTLY